MVETSRKGAQIQSKFVGLYNRIQSFFRSSTRYFIDPVFPLWEFFRFLVVTHTLFFAAVPPSKIIHSFFIFNKVSTLNSEPICHLILWELLHSEVHQNKSDSMTWNFMIKWWHSVKAEILNIAKRNHLLAVIAVIPSYSPYFQKEEECLSCFFPFNKSRWRSIKVFWTLLMLCMKNKPKCIIFY